ncbi:MAG: hypothetical protein PHP03_03200 [Candidatus Pacebacteria bacterium]|nr:hypothetical protein [Candidatus Paceibacterota bacterium]
MGKFSQYLKESFEAVLGILNPFKNFWASFWWYLSGFFTGFLSYCFSIFSVNLSLFLILFAFVVWPALTMTIIIIFRYSEHRGAIYFENHRPKISQIK